MSSENNNGFSFLFGILVMLIAALIFLMGWGFAHNTVARECKHLGSFYVGDTVYECQVKAKRVDK
jgi:hypothetical protein